MIKKISQSVYFVLTAILILMGLITRFFLDDVDLGSRFKNFNKTLLVSDILFIWAAVLLLAGLIFYIIRKNQRATLKDSTVIVSALLIMPMTFVVAFGQVYDTFYPGPMGETAFSSFMTYFVLFGTFALFSWVILLLVTFLKQVFVIILKSTGKAEK